MLSGALILTAAITVNLMIVPEGSILLTLAVRAALGVALVVMGYRWGKSGYRTT